MHYPLRLFVALLASLILLTPLALRGTAHAQSDQRCFAETNLCISGRLRQFYEQNGDVPVFGLPISPQGPYTADNGQVVQAQWFEHQRLELHPENAPPYDVELGRLGVDRLAQEGIDWFMFPPFDGGPSCGRMRIALDHNDVSGSFGNGGSIDGTVSGNTLSGTWSYNGGNGSFSATLAPDGQSFVGTWQPGNQLWCGWRDGASEPSVCDS